MFARGRREVNEPAEMSTTSAFAQLEAEEQKRLLDKLAKLKALSECQTGNVNETATAAATMTRIMLEYQIQMADIEFDCSPSALEILRENVYPEASLNGHPYWKRRLLSILAKANHCQSFSSSCTGYTLWTRRTYSSLCLIGTEKDIENTRRLFLFCVDEIERLCRSWGVGQPVKRKNDFKKGAAIGICDKVEAERERVLRQEQERANSQALISQALELFGRKARAVQQYANQLGVHTTTVQTRQASADAYHSGYAAGASLDLGRGARPALPPARR
jgi:hypothetical protein